MSPGAPIFLSKGTSKIMLAGSVYANQPGVPRERQQVLELRCPHRIGDITVKAFPVGARACRPPRAASILIGTAT